jgi:hypothetical protein
VERLKNIGYIEWEFRRNGIFLLVDTDGKLKVYGRHQSDACKPLLESIRTRVGEMSNFLIARARARGETT